MTPQFGFISVCVLLTVHQFCAAGRVSVAAKARNLVVEENATRDEGHTVRVIRTQSHLYVDLVHGGSTGEGEGTVAMASIVRTALAIFPQAPEPLDDHGRPLNFEPRVRLLTAWGSDLFWILMGMAPDTGILTESQDELLVHGVARRFQEFVMIQQIVKRVFKVQYEALTDAIDELEDDDVDFGELQFPDLPDESANPPPLSVLEKLLLASFWYVARVGEPQGWCDISASAAKLKVTLPASEGALFADLNDFIADFRQAHAQPGASTTDVVSGMGHFNYVTHRFVPTVFGTLQRKAQGRRGVKLELDQNYHLSPEGRKRWTETFTSAGLDITANPAAIEHGVTTDLRQTTQDRTAASFFKPFHDLGHLFPWMTDRQQERARGLAEEIARRRETTIANE